MTRDLFLLGLVVCAPVASAMPLDPLDINGDGQVDRQDVDLITAASFGPYDSAFDLVADGIIDAADRDKWLTDAGATYLNSGAAFVAEDANLDGAVNAIDFAIWSQNKFQTTGTFSQYDINLDQTTDGSDFLAWNTKKFTSQGVSSIEAPVNSTFVSPGVMGDGVPDLTFDDGTGLLSIDLDGASLSALIVEGPDAIDVDWPDGAFIDGGVSLTNGYIANAENWVVTSPIFGTVPWVTQQFTIAQYIEGASSLDIGDITVVLDDGTIYRTRLVPTPSALAILGLGGLAATRRRR